MIAEKHPPLLKYAGGKNLLADWILQHIPAHDSYVEPFAGGSSVLLRKSRAKNEILNDMDGDLVALLTVMSDRKSAASLIRRIKWTPYSEQVLHDAYHMDGGSMEDRAWRIYVMSWMSRTYTLDGAGEPAMRVVVNNTSGGHVPARVFARVRHLYAISKRLREVQILNRDYREVMEMCNRPDVVAYIDPPYLGLTRSNNEYYNHELITVDEHVELLEVANRSRAAIVMSGYDSELYNRELAHWKTVRRGARVGSTKRTEKTEVLYINQLATERLGM